MPRGACDLCATLCAGNLQDATVNHSHAFAGFPESFFKTAFFGFISPLGYNLLLCNRFSTAGSAGDYLPHVRQVQGICGNDFMVLVADLHQQLLPHVLYPYLKLSPIDAVAQGINGCVCRIPPCSRYIKALLTQGFALIQCLSTGQRQHTSSYLRQSRINWSVIHQRIPDRTGNKQRGFNFLL